MGACGAQQASSCVYIGDTGNNTGRGAAAIYRVAEPTADGLRGFVQAEVVRYTYPDERHDVEAMYVAPNGDVVLITKRPLPGRSGRLRQALVFRVPASAWGAADRVVAQLTDSLPIVPGSVPFSSITDASLAPDGRHVAVRTYAQVFIFATDSVTGAVNHAVTPTVCDLAPLGELSHFNHIAEPDARMIMCFRMPPCGDMLTRLVHERAEMHHALGLR